MIIFRCSCGKQLKVKEERARTKVKCPECEEILRVPDAGGIKETSGPASAPPKTRPKPMDDGEGFAEEERRPRRQPARYEDDEEDRPRRRAARYDEDEDEREPHRRQAKGGHGLMIGLIVGGVLLLAGVGGGLFFFLRSSGSPRDLIVGHWKVTEGNKRKIEGIGIFSEFTKDGHLRFAVVRNGRSLGGDEFKYKFVNDETIEVDNPKIEKAVQLTIVSISQDKLVLLDKKKGEKAEYVRVSEFELQRAIGGGDLKKAGEKVRWAAAKTQLSNNLKQITLAMHSFNDAYKRLPSPGFSKDPKLNSTKPLLSWRVAILPYVEEINLYREFKLDEPWDGPNNIKLLNKMPRIYAPVGPQPKKDGNTYLQFVTGPGTLFPTPDLPNGRPPGFGIAAIPRTFRDGTSNTIVVVEAAEPMPWTKPADLTIDVANVMEGTVPKLGAFSPDGFFAGMGDGSVRFIDRGKVSDRTIRMAFNPADGNPMPPDWP